MVIHKEYRGKGLGKLMMKFAEEFLVTSFKGSVKTLFLNTKDQQRFYESLGYEQIKPFLFNVIESQKSNLSQAIGNLLGSAQMGQQSRFTSNSSDQSLGNTWYRKELF